MPPIRFEAANDNADLIMDPAVITYNKVLSKTGDDIDINTGAFTAPRQGTYRFFFQCETGQGEGGGDQTDHTVRARVNGADFDKAHNDFNFSNADNGHIHFLFTKELQVGDKVDVYLSAGAISVYSKIKFGGELLY